MDSSSVRTAHLLLHPCGVVGNQVVYTRCMSRRGRARFHVYSTARTDPSLSVQMYSDPMMQRFFLQKKILVFPVEERAVLSSRSF